MSKFVCTFITKENQEFVPTDNRRVVVNRHGYNALLREWTTLCFDCGKPFSVWTTEKKLPGNRRCDLHKKPGTPARIVS